jgi:Tol biopolymer transport system component
MPFGGGQGKWQVSANGGQLPRWSTDGKELYYMDLTYNLFSVPVKNTGSSLQFGVAEKLISNWSAPQVFYDVSPDGKKFLLDRVAQQVSQSVTVVTDFTAGLKK